MLAQQPQIGYTALDSSGSSAVLRFNIQRGVEVPAAQSAATALRGLLAGVTSCAITRQSVVYPAVAPAAPAALAGSNITRVGVFVFSTTEPNEYAIAEVPGLHSSLLMTTGPGAGILIDVDLPAIQAFVQELTSGAWSNLFGFTITTLEAAFLQIRP